MDKFAICAAALVATLAWGTPAAQADSFDQNVTPDIIFGSGNTNGSFTVDQADGVELGLRGKLRHNAAGAPENTFNSNGDGTYSFAAIVAPTQSAPTAVWSFEWSINSNWNGTSGWNLNDLTYVLAIDSDPGAGTSWATFDPINGFNPGAGAFYWDHAVGTNATANGAGTVAGSTAGYATLIDENNVAQNSWKAHWFLSAFDPTADGTYDFRLTAFHDGDEVVSTSMQIITGAGAPVPEPTTWTLLAIGLVGLGITRRRRSAHAAE